MLRKYQAEWEKQHATWLCWPHNVKEWGDVLLPKVKKFYVELITIILDFQSVNLIFPSEDLIKEAEAVYELLLQPRGKFNLKKIVIPNNDIWIRDYGPFFLKKIINGSVESLLVDFRFNGWGEKFPPWDLDDKVPEAIGSFLGVQVESNPMILEGGALDFSGDGLALTTEECLLNKNRNPNYNKEEIENNLKKTLNLEEIIYLKRGLRGDHTDGHIDNVARFVDSHKVLVCRSYDVGYENFDHLFASANYLRNWTHPTKGYKLEVVEIPLPDCSGFRTRKLPCSYANFIFVNRGLIFPTFNCKTDDIASKIFKLLFPDRIVIGIDSTLLIEEGGGLHCMTKEEPLFTNS